MRMHADGSFGVDTLACDARIENGRNCGLSLYSDEWPPGFQACRELSVGKFRGSLRHGRNRAGRSRTCGVPHQANIRIIEMIADKLGIPKDKTVETVQMHGNTSAASVPLGAGLGCQKTDEFMKATP